MNELSRGQLQYLNAYRRGLRIIRISRILIFLSFLFIWEFTANVGIIDSYLQQPLQDRLMLLGNGSG